MKPKHAPIKPIKGWMVFYDVMPSMWALFPTRREARRAAILEERVVPVEIRERPAKGKS